MLIKSLVLKKDYLTTVNEKATLEEALKILEDSGYQVIKINKDQFQVFRTHTDVQVKGSSENTE